VNKERFSLEIRVGTIFFGLILIFSLLGIGAGVFVPEETSKKVVAVDYEHRGAFSIKGYSSAPLFTGQASSSSPMLFSQLIEEMDILFLSEGIEEEIDLSLYLGDVKGNWQKEIPIEVKNTSPISFPISITNLLQKGADINAEIGGVGGNYRLTVVAENPNANPPFKTVLTGDLNSSVLQWNEEGFVKIERGFPGKNDQRSGAFGYRAKLKDNQLYGPVTFLKEPHSPGIEVISSDFQLFTALVESLDVSFDYQFNCEPKPSLLKEEVSVLMVVEEPERWRKEFQLLVHTAEEGEFSLNFPLDIAKLQEMSRDINEQLGGRGARNQNITFSVKVHTIAETQEALIDEVFEHQIILAIGDAITWSSEEESGLISTQGRKIPKTVTEINPVYKPLRKGSLIGLGISFPIFAFLGYLFWQIRPRVSFLRRELKRIKRKYKDSLVETNEIPQLKLQERITNMRSLEDLVKSANNSAEPVLFFVEEKQATFWVEKGANRHRYVVEDN